jgi:hypothetical protein
MPAARLPSTTKPSSVAYLLIALWGLAGAFRAVHDTLTHSPGALAGWGSFWNATTSWQRKYKNHDSTQGPAFLGSTTVFVALTDAWHLSNLLAWLCVDAGLLLVAWPALHWWAVAAVVVRRVVFQPLYSLLRK